MLNKLNFRQFLTVVCFISLSLSGCSYSPGVPGLNDTSNASQAYKKGVDYKLVVINHEAIKKQKPFDAIGYIQNKKKKQRVHLARLIEKQAAIDKQPKRNNTQHKSSASFGGGSGSLLGVSSNQSKAAYQYYIGKRDILSITVWDHPELTIPAGDVPATHVVGNDGKFYFPYAGNISAAGKTVEYVREALEQKLKEFIAKPQVSVRVESYRSQKAYISGALAKLGTLEINDLPLTIRDAISKSGGLIPRKYTGFATLNRNGQKIIIDLNRMLKFNDNSQNFILKNGDRLHVSEIGREEEFDLELDQEISKSKTLNPIRLQFELQKQREVAQLKKELERELKSEQAKIFVMGEVVKPGTVKYQVEDGMTLAEAINDAGSLKEESASPNGIFVVRKEHSKDTIPTVYQLPVSSVHSLLLAEQFNIRPRDIVYVTATPSIRWNRVLGLILPSLTLLNTFDNLSD